MIVYRIYSWNFSRVKIFADWPYLVPVPRPAQFSLVCSRKRLGHVGSWVGQERDPRRQCRTWRLNQLTRIVVSESGLETECTSVAKSTCGSVRESSSLDSGSESSAACLFYPVFALLSRRPDLARQRRIKCKPPRRTKTVAADPKNVFPADRVKA